MSSKRLLIVAYRPMRFYRQYGAIVRDYKFCFDSGFDEVFIVDEVGLWKLVREAKFKLVRINFSPGLRAWGRSRRIWLAKRIESFCRKTIRDLSPDIVVVNHPLVRVFTPADKTLVDIIDNFAKHIRYSEEERQLFIDNTRYANESGYRFLVVTKSAATALKIKDFYCLDNYPLALSEPDAKSERMGMVCVGFFSDRIDWDLLRSLAAGGIHIDLFGRFFDGVEKEIENQKGLSFKGPLLESDKSSVMARYKAMIIPYRAETEHDGSPAKAYDALSCQLPVISTLDYVINNANFHHVANVDQILVEYSRVAWSRSEPVITFGQKFQELLGRFLADTRT